MGHKNTWNNKGEDKTMSLPEVTMVDTFMNNKRLALQTWQGRHKQLRDLDYGLYQAFMENVERTQLGDTFTGGDV